MEKSTVNDSKFTMAILAAKRAKQLVGGARKKVECESDSPLTIAMKELRLGKIKYQAFEVEDEVLEYNESLLFSSTPLILSSDTGLDQTEDEDEPEEEEADYNLDDI